MFSYSDYCPINYQTESFLNICCVAYINLRVGQNKKKRKHKSEGWDYGWHWVIVLVGDVLCGNESKGELHLGVLQEWLGVHWWTSRAFALLLVALFIMLPLVMLRRVGQRSFSLLNFSIFTRNPIPLIKILNCFQNALICRLTQVQFCNINSSSLGVHCNKFIHGLLRLMVRQNPISQNFPWLL